jgi:flagellar protein FlaI
MAEDDLERSLEDLREMESVHINVDPKKEEMVPRPDPPEEVLELCREILARAEEELFPDYRGRDADEVADALRHIADEPDVSARYEDRTALDALDEATRQGPELDAGDDGPSELDEADDDGPGELEDGGAPPLDAGGDGDGESADDADATATPGTDDGAGGRSPGSPDDDSDRPAGATDASEEEFIEELLGEDASEELEEEGWGFGEFENADPEDASGEDDGDGGNAADADADDAETDAVESDADDGDTAGVGGDSDDTADAGEDEVDAADADRDDDDTADTGGDGGTEGGA